MIRELKKGEFGLEGFVEFPLFNKEIAVSIDDNVAIEYAERCADYLGHLDDQVIEKLCEGSIRYCEDNRDYFVDEEIMIPENIYI